MTANERYHRNEAIKAVTGFVLCIVCLACGIHYVFSSTTRSVQVFHAQEAKKHVSWRFDVEEILIRKFDSIDTDNDGLLTRSELLAEAETLNVTSREVEILRYAENYIYQVGHVVKTEEVNQTSYSAHMPNGLRHGFSRRKRKIYAISKNDLSTYTDRILAEFK